MPKFLSMAALAGVIALSLTACSPGGEDAENAECAPTPSGSGSDQIVVEGKFGSEPEVTIPAPLSAESTERSVITKGKGEAAEDGTVASVNYAVYNATTGEKIEASEYTDEGTTSFPIDEAQLLPGLVKALECSNAGSRIVALIPPVDAFQEAGQESFGIGATDSIVFVIDVVEVKEPTPVVPPLEKADGEDQPVPEGFPAVTLAEDGAPTVAIPDEAPPAELQLAVLKKGDGATVEPGSNVVVHYQGTNWNTGEVFDQSWTRGEPATFNTAQVIPGFTAALEGQTVGSQVIVIIPPDLGYGPQGGNEAAGIGPEDTLLFVIDILGIA